MATYTPSKILFPTGLDELGLRLGLVRLSNESLDDYRRRLYLETRQPSGGTFEEYSQSVSRKVALFDVPVLEIDVVVDGDGNPLAEDPVIQVTASKLYAWRDFENEVLDFELLLTSRDDAYFLREVKTAFDASTYFSATVLDSAYTYKKASHLKVGSNRVKFDVPRLESRLVHNFGVTYLRDVRFSDSILFAEEVAALGDLEEVGQYYVDYVKGCVFGYDPLGGFATVEYAQFPHKLWWQQVRTYEFRDEDLKYIIYDNLIGDSEADEPLLLNSVGAKMVDEVLAIHPLEWGK